MYNVQASKNICIEYKTPFYNIEYIKIVKKYYMTVFYDGELNKNNRCNNKGFDIKIIGNTTIYVTLQNTKSLQDIIKELSNDEYRINR